MTAILLAGILIVLLWGPGALLAALGVLAFIMLIGAGIGLLIALGDWLAS
jgi:hypothetical protein